MIDFSIDYCNLFPQLTFEQWDKHYKTFDKFLTANIMRTQMGLSFTVDSVVTWWCVPSARTHVQLDTITMITDNKAVLGEWRVVSNRIITFEDSASYTDHKIYRSSKVESDYKKDDVVLLMTADKFKLYAKKENDSNFKIITNRKYHIENKRR